MEVQLAALHVLHRADAEGWVMDRVHRGALCTTLQGWLRTRVPWHVFEDPAKVKSDSWFGATTTQPQGAAILHKVGAYREVLLRALTHVTALPRGQVPEGWPGGRAPAAPRIRSPPPARTSGCAPSRRGGFASGPRASTDATTAGTGRRTSSSTPTPPTAGTGDRCRGSSFAAPAPAPAPAPRIRSRGSMPVGGVRSTRPIPGFVPIEVFRGSGVS
jgi:hypothetical protein